MPRPPIDPAIRAAIIADFATDKPRNQIARDHHISASTVTKVAQEVGHQFDRAATKRATEARTEDLKALRAVTSRRFLDEANKALDRLNEPYLVHAFGGKDNVYREHELQLPPAGETRNLMTAAAVAFDKHIAADKHDADTGTESARSVLGALGEALQLAAERIDGETGS